jgi:spermidine dehydrogenase
VSRNRNTRGDGVTRRDFIHDISLAGAALTLGVTPGAIGADAAAAPAQAAAGEAAGRYYPPTRTGMRGSHPGAFEAAHAFAREGEVLGDAEALDEDYDLVVVGAGISGLAAAYFYRQQYGPGSRILLLDNHDDFGGHAKRNEFHQGGRLQLAWGGTVNIEYWHYSEVGRRLLDELGIDIERLLADFRFDWGASDTGLDAATWFDAQTYGRDALLRNFSVREFDREALRDAAPLMPLSPSAREALQRFAEAEGDVLAGMSDPERTHYAHRTRYVDFLRDHGGLPDEALRVFSSAMMGSWGVRTDDLSVAECLESGMPGRHLLHLPEGVGQSDRPGRAAMFPDGNASVARLLVRALIPRAFPTMTAESDPFDIVVADLDYAQLDGANSAARLRLNATALHVENAAAGGVAVTYAREGSLYAVRAEHCVMACYNRIIPHICPSLPAAQKAGLAQCIKRPLGTVNVVLRNGEAVQKSGVGGADLPGSLLQMVSVVTGVDAGPYQTQWNPAEPCQLHFFFGVQPLNPEGLDIVQQSQAGRARLLAMEFDDFEREVRRVLEGIWGASGLDVDNDILAITVNRWPHGYARDLIDFEDPAWLASPGPYEIGRQRFGNIAIANSDSGADAYTHTAIDQAWRAVGDLRAVAG